MLLIWSVMLLAVSGAEIPSVTVVPTPTEGEVPDAEVDSRGTVHLAYVAGEDAFYALSINHGRTFGASLRINSEPGTVHPANTFRGPDVAVGKNGRVHVIWYVNSFQRKRPKNEWGVFYSQLDREATSFSPGRNLNQKPSDNYSLACDGDGNVAVVWMAEKLYLTSSRNSGETFERTEVIEVADPCECCASRALYTRDRSLLISYRDKRDNHRDMHLLRRSSVETAFSSRLVSQTLWQIDGCPMTGTFLSDGSDATVMAWETKGQIFFTRWPGGNVAAPCQEIKAAESGKWPIALLGKDGHILVSWKETDTLRWRLFSRTGEPIGEIHSRLSPNLTRHAGVTLKSGDFLLID